MNLSSPTDVRNLLAELGIQPSRSLGQNFLVDANVLRILLDAAAIEPSETVLEVGPGLGVVTEQLTARAARVIAVEKDHRLAAWLARHFGGTPSFDLVEADMLDLDIDALAPGGVSVVVSNLPYRAGSRILVNLARAHRPPARMVLTVQREVGARITAGPGGGDYGLLSIWTQLYYDASVVRVVSRRCFRPVPAVESVIVRLVRRPDAGPGPDQAACLEVLLRTAFSHRRKQLATTLRSAGPPCRMDEATCRAWLEARGLSPRSRPQDIPVDAWRALAQQCAGN